VKVKHKYATGLETGDKSIDNMKIKVCGSRDPHRPSIRCDEPYWMPEHTWHSAAGGIFQWCECGENHHYSVVHAESMVTA
jgi:hypothetical protein